MTYDALVAMPLDHRHGFLLSLVDGRCTVEMLAHISGFGRTETIALLADLVGFGDVTLSRQLAMPRVGCTPAPDAPMTP